MLREPGLEMPDDPLDPDPSATCVLQHRAFHMLSNVTFRRAEADETPVMAMSLGERHAAVPLRALQHELGIEDDSPDGRMLALIAQSLDYVAGLQIGDPLPGEVLDGRASWSPGEAHRALAAARLRLQLASWLRPEAAGVVAPDAPTVLRLDDDPAMRQHVNAALDAVVRNLGLPHRMAVVDLLDRLADELGFIEALRDGLLNRTQAMMETIDHLGRIGRVNHKRSDTLTQVRRLGHAALRQMAFRFEEIDAQTEDVVAALRNLDSQRSFIRSSRDWLYRLQRAWDPLLRQWEATSPLTEIELWRLIERTYRFLAPRYMPVQEWQDFVTGRRHSRRKPIGTVMRW